jgi:hypothetical protein
MAPPRRPSAEDTNPQRRLVRALLNSIRAYQYYKSRSGPIALVMRRLYRLRYEVLSILTGSDVGITAKFGTNFRLPHPIGVVVHDHRHPGRPPRAYHRLAGVHRHGRQGAGPRDGGRRCTHRSECRCSLRRAPGGHGCRNSRTNRRPKVTGSASA